MTDSLVAAFAIGIAFGWTLERAGLGSARKLAGQFYFTDLTVFKVMFSAIITAMLGAFWLARLGVLDLSRVYVPETWLVPQLIGGIVFGAGFVAAGLCPGTSCVSAATGRGDGLAVVAGMFSGVLVTGLAFPRLQALYDSTRRGSLTLPDVLHVPYGVAVVAIVAMALIAFAAASRLTSGAPASSPADAGASRAPASGGGAGTTLAPANRVAARDAAPSAGAGRRRSAALAATALLLGSLAAFARDSHQASTPSLDVERLAAEVVREEDHVTAIELATWIKDRKPGLRVLDLRSEEEFDEYHVPSAERVALDAVVSMRFAPTDTIVLISDGGAHAAQGWVFLRARGIVHVYFLRGGLGEWIDEVMNPAGASAEVAALSRYFGGVPRKGNATKSSVAAIKRRGC